MQIQRLDDPETTFTWFAAQLLDAAPALLREALSRGGDYADLFFECSTFHRTRRLCLGTGSSATRPPSREHDDRYLLGVGIRVLRGDRVGYAATGDLSPNALQAAARLAARKAGPGSMAAPAPAVAPITAPDPAEPLPPDAPDRITPSEKAAVVDAAGEAARALAPRLQRVETVYQDRVRRTLVVTSEGHAVQTATALLGLRVAVRLDAGAKTVAAQAIDGGPGGFGRFLLAPPEWTARDAVARVRAHSAARAMPPGPRPVVLAGGWGGLWLHEAVGHRLEADVARRPAGGVVAPPFVTVVDDATWPGGRGSLVYDDEATPGARTVLIRDGEVCGLLTDRHTARRFGLPCTGNGRRQDYRCAPQPRMTNLLLAPGPAAPGDLIASVRDGLYVEDVASGRLEPETGRFILSGVSGRRIEHGRRTAPVADLRLAASGPDVLAGLQGVASDLHLDAARGMCRKDDQTVPVSVGLPTVLVHGLYVES